METTDKIIQLMLAGPDNLLVALHLLSNEDDDTVFDTLVFGISACKDSQSGVDNNRAAMKGGKYPVIMFSSSIPYIIVGKSTQDKFNYIRLNVSDDGYTEHLVIMINDNIHTYYKEHFAGVYNVEGISSTLKQLLSV